MRHKEPKTCRAPWGCNRLTSKIAGTKGRHIDGLSFCRVCYQYTYEQGHKLGVAPEMWPTLIKDLPGPIHRPPVAKMKCEGSGCGDIIPKGVSSDKRRFVGRNAQGLGIAACRKCYQRAWEYKLKHPGISLEEAWKQMPSRKRRGK